MRGICIGRVRVLSHQSEKPTYWNCYQSSLANKSVFGFLLATNGAHAIKWSDFAWNHVSLAMLSHFWPPFSYFVYTSLAQRKKRLDLLEECVVFMFDVDMGHIRLESRDNLLFSFVVARTLCNSIWPHEWLLCTSGRAPEIVDFKCLDSIDTHKKWLNQAEQLYRVYSKVPGCMCAWCELRMLYWKQTRLLPRNNSCTHCPSMKSPMIPTAVMTFALEMFHSLISISVHSPVPSTQTNGHN